MKKPLIQLMTLLLTIILTAFSSPSARTTPSIPIVENTTNLSLVTTSMSGIVTFADPVLEAMVRGSMGKPEGDITLAEAGRTRMNLSNELQHYYSSVADQGSQRTGELHQP